MGLKIKFYIFEVLEELKQDSETNSALIKKLKEVMPFYDDLPDEEFFNKLDYFLGIRDKSIFFIIYAQNKDFWDKKDIMFIGDFCSFLAKYEIGIDYYSAYINIFFKDPNYSLIVKICNDSYGFSYSGLLDLLFLKYNILTEKDEVTKLLIDMAKICNQPFYNLPDIYSYLHNLLKDLTKDKQLLDFENFRLVEQLKNFINLQDEDLKTQITQELADILSQTISDEEKLTGCLTIIKKYEVNSLTRIKPNENE